MAGISYLAPSRERADLSGGDAASAAGGSGSDGSDKGAAMPVDMILWVAPASIPADGASTATLWMVLVDGRVSLDGEAFPFESTPQNCVVSSSLCPVFGSLSAGGGGPFF